MERQVYREILEWKKNPDRKPLMLRGARQVGKTWILQEFGRQEFAKVAYLNCDRNEQAETLFQTDFDIKRIIRGISALTGVEITPEDTFIILDEIQEVPRAIQSLKYFCEEGKEYYVCAAGSLLGIKLRGEHSFPVGKVDEIDMYPMNFEEFVNAADGRLSYNMLREGEPDEICALSGKWKELLRQYYYTGGMPEVVRAYTDGKGLATVRQIQNSIISNYNDDISKHTDERTAIRIHQVWDTIASQLAKENKKFIYANIQKGARAREYEIALQWLTDAGLVYRIPCVTKATLPLKFYEEMEIFKLYYLDCGLMGALTEAPAAQILIGDNVFVEYKGAFTEQFVMQQLITVHTNKIYYYHPEGSRQEIDFMTQYEGRILAIEVKAEENLRAKSLRLFKAENPAVTAIRLSMSNYKTQDWLVNIPLYLSSRIFGLV